MDRLVDLRAGAVVGRNDQRVFGRLRILLLNSRDAVFMTWHLMDAALPLQSGDSLSHLATRKLLDGLLQLRIALADNLLQLHRLHARVLELDKDAARLDGFILARVAYQQNAVVRMQAAHKLVHLLGGRKRTLVHHIEPVLARVRPLASGKMGLQSLGLDTGLAQLLRRAGRGRKALDLVPGMLRALAHHGQRRSLARAGDSIQTDNLLARERSEEHTSELQSLRHLVCRL